MATGRSSVPIFNEVLHIKTYPRTTEQRKACLAHQLGRPDTTYYIIVVFVFMIRSHHRCHSSERFGSNFNFPNQMYFS